MNIFLTGEVNIGKSTIVEKFLQTYSNTVGGFKTIRCQTENDAFYGVYILDVGDEDAMLSKENRVGDCFPDKSLISYGSIFDTIGVDFLSFETEPSLIVMDELGILEKNAVKFQNKVHGCLNSDASVLGIIKNKNNSFLDSIRKRNDIVLLEVNEDNRNAMLEKVTELLL